LTTGFVIRIEGKVIKAHPSDEGRGAATHVATDVWGK
jgi:hypothetical protein